MLAEHTSRVRCCYVLSIVGPLLVGVSAIALGITDIVLALKYSDFLPM